MLDDISTSPRNPAPASRRQSATVTDLATRRDRNNVLGSITVVFGGVNYGTIPIRAPYAAGKPFALYLVPARGAASPDGVLDGPLDCLITDDPALSLELDAAR